MPYFIRYRENGKIMSRIIEPKSTDFSNHKSDLLAIDLASDKEIIIDLKTVVQYFEPTMTQHIIVEVEGRDRRIIPLSLQDGRLEAYSLDEEQKITIDITGITKWVTAYV